MRRLLLQVATLTSDLKEQQKQHQSELRRMAAKFENGVAWTSSAEDSYNRMEHENCGLRARLKKAEDEVRQLKRSKPQTSLNDVSKKADRLDKALGERTAELAETSQQLRLRDASLREVSVKYAALEGNYTKVVQGVVRKAQRFEERKFRPIPRQVGINHR